MKTVLGKPFFGTMMDIPSTICSVAVKFGARPAQACRGFTTVFLVLVLWALPAVGLDRATVEVTAGDTRHLFLVELARTPVERERGLMDRQNLPLNAGMLFVFEREEPINMWMKDTYISLDMIFADKSGRVVSIAHRTVPMSLEIISSGVPANTVLEVRGGTAERLGIDVGATIVLRP